MKMWVWSLAFISGLRIWHCHELGCGVGRRCSSNETPSLGTSICHEWGPKKKKKVYSLFSIISTKNHSGNCNYSHYYNVMTTEAVFLCVCMLFLELHPWHIKVPRLGLDWSCSYQPKLQPQQYRIQAASATYGTTHGNTRSLTHWARPGIKPTSSQILVGFIIHWAMTGTPKAVFFIFLITIPTAYGNSWARDWIWTAALIYAIAVATSDPLTYCTGLGIEPKLPQQLKPLQLDS